VGISQWFDRRNQLRAVAGVRVRVVLPLLAWTDLLSPSYPPQTQRMEEQVLAKKPLTDRAIGALKPAAKGKRKLHWDATVPGFAVRVTESGNKSFVFFAPQPNFG
jgi:hypothetical protein